jgi:hypothetical protein
MVEKFGSPAVPSCGTGKNKEGGMQGAEQLIWYVRPGRGIDPSICFKPARPGKTGKVLKPPNHAISTINYYTSVESL